MSNEQSIFDLLPEDDKMKKKDELHNTLITMISECYESLTDSDEDAEGNAGWEIV